MKKTTQEEMDELGGALEGRLCHLFTSLLLVILAAVLFFKGFEIELATDDWCAALPYLVSALVAALGGEYFRRKAAKIRLPGEKDKN